MVQVLRLAMAIWLYCGGVWTARRVDVKAKFEEKLGRRSLHRRSVETEDWGKQNAIWDFLEPKGEETLSIKDFTKTSHGTIIWRLEEYYKNIPVFDATMTVETDYSGSTTFDGRGHFITDIESDLGPNPWKLTPSEALDLAIQESGDEHLRDKIQVQKLQKEVFLNEESLAYPGYFIQYLIETKDVEKRPTLLMDARTGVVLLKVDSIEKCDRSIRQYGGNTRIGRIRYGGDAERCLDVRREGNTCYLENRFGRVIDMNFTEDMSYNVTASFTCDELYGDEINGAYSPAIDAIFYATRLGKMFEEWYDFRPYPQGILLRVHFSTNLLAAFWNGGAANFGDGDLEHRYPYVVADVLAHEVAHGITQGTSSLLSEHQPGAINEAFSDMTGEVFEEYIGENDWLGGMDVSRDGEPLRYFGNPGKDTYGVYHISNYSNDLWSHRTSSIYNYPFYLLVNNHDLHLREAYNAFLHANRMYWHSLITFERGACDVIKSVYDVGLPAAPFIDSFAAVGIEVCDINEHVLALRHNQTHDNIVVSNTIKPVFELAGPMWAEYMFVEATSSHGDVNIAIWNVTWAEIDRNGSPLAQGVNFVKYDKPELNDEVLSIQLSGDTSEEYRDVTVVGGYKCWQDLIPHFKATKDWFTLSSYKYKCKVDFY